MNDVPPMPGDDGGIEPAAKSGFGPAPDPEVVPRRGAAGRSGRGVWQRSWSWIRRHPKTAAAIVLAAAAVLLNVSAFLHAYAMTHYATGGRRTESPEALSLVRKAQVLLMGVRVPRPENDRTPADLKLPFEVHRFPSSDGTECEGWLIPSARSRGLCLLFPGYAEPKSRVLDEARVLLGLDYDSFLVDFRGCGGSSGSRTTIGYREADDVAAAVAYARRRWPETGPLILYGRSMGSAAVLRAVGRMDVDADAVILESPFDSLLTTVENRFSAMSLPAFPSAQLLVFWGGVQHGFWAFSHNPAEYARQVRCPALLLHGAADPRATRRQSQSVANQLGGRCEFHLFDGAVHESLLKAQPERWTTEVTRFLESLQAD